MNDNPPLPEGWARIRILMLDKSIPYASHLAKMVGLKSPLTFYFIKKGQYRISLSLAEKFKAAFPELNSGWLLTGEGPMYVDSSVAPTFNNMRSVPIYSPYGSGRVPVKYFYGHAPVCSDADLGVICQPYFNGNKYIPLESVIYLQKTDSILRGSQYVVTKNDEHYIGDVLSEGASRFCVLGYDGTQSPLLPVREILDHFRIIGWTVINK